MRLTGIYEQLTIEGSVHYLVTFSDGSSKIYQDYEDIPGEL